MAALLKRELGIDVALEHGPYGSFKILNDGHEILDAGAMAALGVVPGNATIVETVRREMTEKH